MKLQPKQEAFCLAYIETGNASEAYRLSYDAVTMSASAINVEASRLLDNPKITLRLDELRQPIMERHNVTVDSLLAELEENRQLAIKEGQAAAANGSTMGKAKLLGMDKQIIDHQSTDGSMATKATLDTSKLSDEQLAALLDARIHDPN